MSGGGSAGDAGSTSQEATNFEDYNTTTTEAPAADYDDSFASQNTSTSSSGFEGSPEVGGSRTDTSGPTYDTSYDSGGADPAVPSTYKAGIGKTDYFNPNDTITSYKNNVNAELRASPVLALATPIGLLGKVAIQTAKARSMLDLPLIPGGSKSSGGNTTNISSAGGDNDSNTMNVVRQVNVQGTGLPEPSSFITQTSFPNTNLTMQLYNQMKGLLNTPSKIGLLAVNESPFYDFLKQRNLDRRVL